MEPHGRRRELVGRGTQAAAQQRLGDACFGIALPCGGVDHASLEGHGTRIVRRDSVRLMRRAINAGWLAMIGMAIAIIALWQPGTIGSGAAGYRLSLHLPGWV